ncbi:MAG TPA: NYN domain-containing protein, partial [Chloroflexota bacterium]
IKYSLLNRENRLPNAQTLKEAAGRYGRVVHAKAYANWQEGQNLRDPNDLYAVGIEPIYVPTIFIGPGESSPDGMPRRKNSVDVKLAVDAVEFALTNPNVSTFVLVTGDGDFIHLVNTLRTRGKRVIVIGTSWNTSWQLTSSADQFVAYDVEVDPSNQPSPKRSNATPSLDEAFRVLVDVVRHVREKRRPNVFAQIKLLMIGRLGNFDEQAYGFAKFKDFMKEAERRGYIKTTTAGLTDRAYLPHEIIEEAGDTGSDVVAERSGSQVERNGSRAGADEERLLSMIAFVNRLEESSPFMSFNYIVSRTHESRVLPCTQTELSALLDTAIHEGIFHIDSRTILDRATGEYRDINVFRLNRQHPLVRRAVGLVADEEEPADQTSSQADQPS